MYRSNNQHVVKLRKMHNLIKIFICTKGYEFALLVDI